MVLIALEESKKMTLTAPPWPLQVGVCPVEQVDDVGLVSEFQGTRWSFTGRCCRISLSNILMMCDVNTTGLKLLRELGKLFLQEQCRRFSRGWGALQYYGEVE